MVQSGKTTMPSLREIRTSRLVLRRWRDEDAAPYAELNADPIVREFLPGVLTREESDASIARYEAHIDQHGFGLWAVELVAEGTFIGMAGLAHVRFDAPFVPAVEIGWRIAHAHWGKGYATEAARAALGAGFEHFDRNEIVSFTLPKNERSRRVMEKIGMTRDQDFEHPSVPRDHPQSLHSLYRLRKDDWTRALTKRDWELVLA